MKISNIAFSFRYGIHALICGLGYFAPWDRWLHLDQGRTLWLLLVSAIGSLGWTTFDRATVSLLGVAILLAFAAASLRTWAAAFLGIATVQAPKMQSISIVAAGPYRYLRNPLYLGTMLHASALALIMPPTGALFAIVATGSFQFFLIAGEQDFLTQAFGSAYLSYCHAVPSILPVLHSKMPHTHQSPKWASSFVGELYMWGSAISFLVLGWRYNAVLIFQGVLVSMGLSLVIRAITPPTPARSAEVL